MYNISICIPTYKRPLKLKKLIHSILACHINRSVIKAVNLIVVDNDIGKTAEKIVRDLTDELCGIYTLHYYNHPAKGLSNVRNELFRKAIEFNSDYIIGMMTMNMLLLIG